MSEKKVRWGILGAADIARKNWKSIQNSGNAVVSAVACRDEVRGRRFISECQGAAPFGEVPRLVGSYQALVEAADVDAVYVPLPTGCRREWVIAAARAGKHVVCEKPCATSLEELEEMTGACKAAGVQFMDGVMFMHSRRLEQMRGVLDTGEAMGTGAVRRISSEFSFRGSEEFFQGNIRMDPELEPHGCLGDLGWYCLRLSLWTMKEALPYEVTGRMLRQGPGKGGRAGVPVEFSGELLFGGGASAGFYCSFVTENQEWAVISGERGSIHIQDFVLPYYGAEVGFETRHPEFEVRGCTFNMVPRSKRWSVAEYSDGHPRAQETHLFRDFSAQVLSGVVREDWVEMALRTQRVMEACLESARGGGRAVRLAGAVGPG